MPDVFPCPIDTHAAEAAAIQAADAAARGVIGTLRVARALVDCQRHVDLAGLDSAVGALCAQVLDLAPDSSRALRGVLIEILTTLDALEAAFHQATP